MKDLEWDILKVFSNNVMPANAAAWYMAKVILKSLNSNPYISLDLSPLFENLFVLNY
jgi:hypothetical protein